MADVTSRSIQHEYLDVVNWNALDTVEFLQANEHDYTAIEEEYVNVLAALDESYQSENWKILVEGVPRLYAYWQVKSLWRDAIKYLALALKASVRSGNLSDQGLALKSLGNVYLTLGDLPQSLASYKSALTAYRRAGDHIGMARVYGNYGTVYIRMGKSDKAIGYLEKSLNITEAAGEESISANQYDNLARLYSDLGEMTKAEQYLLKSLRIRRRLKQTDKIGDVYINLGIVYYQRCEWTKATSYYESARKIFEKLDDKHRLAMIYGNQGANCHYSGRRREDWQRALGLLQKSVILYKQLGPTVYGLARTYFALGDLYLNMGKWERALNCYNEAQLLVNQEGSASSIAAQPQTNIAAVYLEMGQGEKALQLFEGAQAWLEQYGDPLPLIEFYSSLSAALLNTGNVKKAFKYSHKCLSLAEGLGDEYRRGKALAYRTMAKVQNYRGEFKVAAGQFTESLNLYRQLGMWYEVGRTLYEMALCEEPRNSASAKRIRKRSHDIFGRLGASKDLERVEQSQAG